MSTIVLALVSVWSILGTKNTKIYKEYEVENKYANIRFVYVYVYIIIVKINNFYCIPVPNVWLLSGVVSDMTEH